MKKFALFFTFLGVMFHVLGSERTITMEDNVIRICYSFSNPIIVDTKVVR